jgi:iron complex outermembrane receptor protein
LGDFDNVGATRRRGVDMALRYAPWPVFAIHAALSRQKALITRPDPATPDLLGREVDHVPNWLFSRGADIALTPALQVSLLAQGQSHYWLTSRGQGGRSGDRLTAQAQLDWQALPGLSLSAAVKNLTDARYAYAWWDGAQVLVSPAHGRSLQLGLRVRL